MCGRELGGRVFPSAEGVEEEAVSDGGGDDGDVGGEALLLDLRWIGFGFAVFESFFRPKDDLGSQVWSWFPTQARGSVQDIDGNCLLTILSILEALWS